MELKPPNGSIPKDRTVLVSRFSNLNIKTITRWLSDTSLTKKAYLNALATTLDYGARLIVGFFLTPYLVSGLGDYLYGAWRLLDRLVSYISPATGRPAEALKTTIANQQASTDYEAKRNYVGSAVVVALLFMPILALPAILLIWLLPSLLETPTGYSQIVQWSAGLLIAGLALSNLIAVPRSVLEGENLGYKRMGLSALMVFISGGMTALALFLKTGLIGVALASLAGVIVTGIFSLWVVRTYVPWFGIGKPSRQSARQFLSLSGWFLVWNLIRKLMMSGDLVVLGLLHSVEIVTAYSLVKYAPDVLFGFISNLVFGVMPGLGGLIGAGKFEKASQVRDEINSLTWLIVTIISTTILLWNQTFLRLWVGAEYYTGPVTNLLIIVMLLQFSLIRNDANIIDLTLNLRRKVTIGIISATLSLVIAGLLVKFFNAGIVGVCLGFIIGRSILSLSYPLIISRFLKIQLSSQLKNMLRPAFVTLVLFSLATWLSSYLETTNWLNSFGWIDLILLGGVTFCTAALITFFVGLPSGQREFILQRIQTAFKTRTS